MFGFAWQFLPPGSGNEPEEVESLILPIGFRLDLNLTPCKYAQKVKMRCNTRSPVSPLTKGSWLNLQWASCFLWKENRWLMRGRSNGRTIQQKFFLPGSESKFLGMRAGILLMVLLLQLMMLQRCMPHCSLCSSWLPALAPGRAWKHSLPSRVLGLSVAQL